MAMQVRRPVSGSWTEAMCSWRSLRGDMAKGLSLSIDLELDGRHELHPLEQAREMVRLHALRLLEHELDGDAVFRKAARSEGKRKEAAGGEETHHAGGSVRVFTGAGDAEEYGASGHDKEPFQALSRNCEQSFPALSCGGGE